MLLKTGPFAGTRVRLAPTDRLDRDDGLLEDFMRRIFGFEPEDYVLTDEARLSHQMSFGKWDPRVHELILTTYGVDTSALSNATIVDVLDAIAARR